MDRDLIIGIAAVAAVLALIWAVARSKSRHGRGSDGYDGGAAVMMMGADASDGSSSCDSGDSGGGDCGGGDCAGGGGGGGGGD